MVLVSLQGMENSYETDQMKRITPLVSEVTDLSDLRIIRKVKTIKLRRFTGHCN